MAASAAIFIGGATSGRWRANISRYIYVVLRLVFFADFD
jgi:hypothetical protein